MSIWRNRLRPALILAALLALLGYANLPSMRAGAQERREAAPATIETVAQFLPLPARPVVSPAIDCAALAGRSFADVAEGPARILSAEIEPARGERAEFCVAKGYVAPTIQFELRLPTRTYTGRYLQGGCGGNCGVVSNRVSPFCDMKPAFGGAFAVGFENSGHVGGDGVWALGGEQVRIDFAYRASHAFAHAARAIIKTYYGQPPAFSYFQGCSDGGREALTQAQRYPKDFDGIVAGSPAHLITEAMERFLWEARWGHDEAGRPVFDEASLKLLHGAVMRSCDALDGLNDGQIDEPRRCRFDPEVLACGAGAAPGTCLTPAQAQAARRFYQGPVDEAGWHLYPGGEPYGAELTWGGRGSLAEAGLVMIDENVRNAIFLRDLPEDVTVRNWKFDAPTLRELSRRGAIYDANDPDLRPFAAAGAKLLIWYGAADPAMGVDALPDYYQRVQNAVGGLNATQRFARMFPLPGVYHCGSGYMPYEVDFLGAIVNWVEAGAAPDRLIASARMESGKVRTRPIFPYPARAKYLGKGDVDAAASFVATAPTKPLNDLYPWLGQVGQR